MVGRSNGAASVYEEDEHEELVPSGVTRNGHSSCVYEEYLDLLGEKPELDAAADENEDSFPLDVNLLSSLTRWTSVAKHRVGEQRLNEMLDLYNQSGHLSVSLRELLLKISAMVDEVPQESLQDPQGCVDLIFPSARHPGRRTPDPINTTSKSRQLTTGLEALEINHGKRSYYRSTRYC